MARFQGARVTEERVRIRPMGGHAGLEGPAGVDIDDPAGPPTEGGAVTGSRMVAWIDPVEGLGGLWLGTRRIAGSVSVVVDGELATPTGRFSWATGGWSGTRETPSGRIVREIGLLPDIATACLIQWSLDAGADATVDVRLDTGTPAVRLPVGPRGRALAIISPAQDAVPDGRLTPVRARERQRQSRHSRSGRPAAGFRVDGRTPPEVERAIRVIEESSLGDPSRPGVERFLDRFGEGVPRYCAGADLEILGSAALAVGRPGLARGCLRCLADDPSEAPGALLGLSSLYFEWTADGSAVLAIEGVLKEAILAFQGDGAPPAGVRTLSRFESAVEPLGLSGLRAASEARRARLQSREVEGRFLPTAPPDGEPSRNGDPEDIHRARHDVPPLVLHPPISTASAARFLDAWTSRALGLRPEAAYGRVVFSPRLTTDGRSLGVSDLPVGDGAVSFTISGAGNTVEMRTVQTRGRVPINLACEPWIPAIGLSAVHIDGEPAVVQASEEGEGTRIRFQLPLDSERRIRFSFLDP